MNESEYVVTFFTHYEALLFQRRAESFSIQGKLAPVPRKLSSSCGTCMLFTATEQQMEQLCQDAEFQQLAVKEGPLYRTVLDHR